jgi:hypothetical protein
VAVPEKEVADATLYRLQRNGALASWGQFSCREIRFEESRRQNIELANVASGLS